VDLIGVALRSPTSRVVNLTVNKVDSSKPSLTNLKTLLQQVIDVSGFKGVTEIYMLDLETGQELQLAYQDGKTLSPVIAFSAESTMKVPVMISILRRATKPVSANVTALMEQMIEFSDDTAPDTLMKLLIDPNLGPLSVTSDMKALGLQNTFLGAMFYLGAPGLQIFKTPANQRTDVNTDPDTLSQTTPSEMGSLLEDIYQCAQNGGGAFAAVFPGQLTQEDCRSMIVYLSRNAQAGLLRGGLPDGTQVAHKHGWAVDKVDGLMHAVADSGIIYSPGGNYIMSVYVGDTNQVLYDTANSLIQNLSRAVYNYFNLTSQ
jgi:beta-lactamase class A